MTILPPPPKPERPEKHGCRVPGKGVLLPKSYRDGALWECPECGRWWVFLDDPGFIRFSDTWRPVRWYDVPARRRIAAHETEKMHYRVPTIVGDLHWWHCHPNPNRGRP